MGCGIKVPDAVVRLSKEFSRRPRLPEVRIRWRDDPDGLRLFLQVPGLCGIAGRSISRRTSHFIRRAAATAGFQLEAAPRLREVRTDRRSIYLRL